MITLFACESFHSSVSSIQCSSAQPKLLWDVDFVIWMIFNRNVVDLQIFWKHPKPLKPSARSSSPLPPSQWVTHERFAVPFSTIASTARPSGFLCTPESRKNNNIFAMTLFPLASFHFSVSSGLRSWVKTWVENIGANDNFVQGLHQADYWS